MKLFKYNQFLSQNNLNENLGMLNENLDKAKKFMKERELLLNAASDLGLVKGELKAQLDHKEKRSLILSDFTPEQQEEIKQKMRDNHADFSKENHPRWGYKFSLEEKILHSDLMKNYYVDNPDKIMSGSKNPMYGKGKNYKAISPSGEIFEIREGIIQFCKDRGLNISAPMRCAQKKQSQCQGWKFEYLTD